DDVSYFFFSSRRRHTRFSRDWSSDVCSSDLLHGEAALRSPGAPVGSDDDGVGEEREELHPVGARLVGPEQLGRGDDRDDDPVGQIGRASCRERVEIRVAAATLEKNKIYRT